MPGSAKCDSVERSVNVAVGVAPFADCVPGMHDTPALPSSTAEN